jgi:VanZ family protein
MINFYKVILFLLLFIFYIIFMLFPRNLFTDVLGGDNFGHIYLNSILTIITLLIMNKKKFILSLSIVFASTTLIEFLQLFTTRSFSYYDLFYNLIGIAVGVIFYKLLMLIIINSSVFFKKFFN